MLLCMLLLEQQPFFWITERRASLYDSFSSTMLLLVSTTALLLFGPGAIWNEMLILLIYSINLWHSYNWLRRLSLARNFVRNVAAQSRGALLALQVYMRLGGMIPLADPEPGWADSHTCGRRTDGAPCC